MIQINAKHKTLKIDLNKNELSTFVVSSRIERHRQQISRISMRNDRKWRKIWTKADQSFLPLKKKSSS